MASPRPAKRARTASRSPRTRIVQRRDARGHAHACPRALGQAAQLLALGHRDGVARRAARPRRARRTCRRRSSGRCRRGAARAPSDTPTRAPAPPRRRPRGRSRDRSRRSGRAGRAAMRAGRVALRSLALAGLEASWTRTLTAAPSRAMPAGTRAIAVGRRPRSASPAPCRPGAPRRARRPRARPRRRTAARARRSRRATAPIDGRRRVDAERALDDRLVAGAVAGDRAQHVRALARDRDRAAGPATGRRRASTCEKAAPLASLTARLTVCAPPLQRRAPLTVTLGRLLVDRGAADARRGGREPGARDRADGEADLGRAAHRRGRDRRVARRRARRPPSAWRRAPARAPPRPSGRRR